jgi:hypothetical protein
MPRKDDWRDDGAYRQREAETATPFFEGFGGGGGLTPPPFGNSELLCVSSHVKLILNSLPCKLEHHFTVLFEIPASETDSKSESRDGLETRR